MKRNKGFTLIELIAVITILTVVALITIPAVNKAITKSKDKAYETQKTAILAAAKQWNLENVGSNLGKTQINYDVLFILDITGSMAGPHFISTVNATNQILQLLMDANENNKVQIILFADTTYPFFELDHYNAGPDGNFLLTTSSSSATTAEGVTNSAGTVISDTFATTGCTNIQFGIKDGIVRFINSIKSSGSSKDVPAVILLTDGDPCYSYNDYINLESSTQSSSSPQMLYNIVLTAQYYKDLLSTETAQQASFYTVGLDLTTDYALALLDPVPAKLSNYTPLRDMLESVSNPIKPYNYADMSFTGTNMTQEDILNIFKTALSDAISDTGKIDIQTLVENGYIDKTALTDPRTGEAMNGYIDVTYDAAENKYTYEYVEN